LRGGGFGGALVEGSLPETLMSRLTDEEEIVEFDIESANVLTVQQSKNGNRGERLTFE
jgi:hypothetical protein